MTVFNVPLLIAVLGLSRAQDFYECPDLKNTTKPHVFKSLEEYKTTDISFKTQENWVSFSVKIPRLTPDIFSTHESNYIRKLTLQEKDIREIDDDAFNDLYCTKSLSLRQNLLYDLNTGTFNGLLNLEELDLSHNKLTGIAANVFLKLDHLLELDLSYNTIEHLSADTFKALDDLWQLNLSHNNLLDLPSDMFKALPRLHWLFLGSNKMSVITTPSLRFLDQLDNLDLSNNGISYIYESMFRPLKKVTSISLNGNELKRLNIQNFHSTVPMLVKLSLHENPWDCDELQKMITEMEKFHIGVILRTGLKTQNITIGDIGCADNNGPTPAPAPTPTPDNVPDDVRDDGAILTAIENIKSYIVALIVIVVFALLVVFIFKNNCVVFTRRRPVLSFQGAEQGSSLPLIAR